jgi:plasmid stabilization system protein ParE
MSLPVILRPEAEADLREARDYLEHVQAGLGRRFVTRVREVLERIESMPEMYGMIFQDIRAARTTKFRYIVYYVLFADRVEVIAVLHGSRDASAWQSRM